MEITFEFVNNAINIVLILTAILAFCSILYYFKTKINIWFITSSVFFLTFLISVLLSDQIKNQRKTIFIPYTDIAYLFVSVIMTILILIGLGIYANNINTKGELEDNPNQAISNDVISTLTKSKGEEKRNEQSEESISKPKIASILSCLHNSETLEETEINQLISPLFMSKLMHRLVVEMTLLSEANAMDRNLINVLISYKYKEIENIVQKVVNDFVKKKLSIEYLGSIDSTFLDKLIEEFKNAQK